MKLSDTKKELIISKLQQDIDAANRYYQETIEPDVIERYDIYHAQPEYYRKKFPKLSKVSDLVSTDVADTIESTMPSIQKIFFGSTDVVSIQGADGSDADDSKANTMQELINYQLTKNKFFTIFYQCAKDALITNLGIIKVDWDREYKDQQQTIQIGPDELQAFQAEKDIQIDSIEPDLMTGSFFVTFTSQVVSKNQPRVRNVLASEFRFSPDAINLADADFVAHRKIVNIDYLRKRAKEGMYSDVETLAQKAKDPEYTMLDEHNNDNISERTQQTDVGRRKVELYECYVNMNMSDDPEGELVPMIITVSNGVPLRIEENTYGRHPFFTLSPRLDPHKVWPEKGFVDLIAQLQHLKTAMLRQIVHNVALSNNPQIALNMNALVDVNDVIEARQVIRLNSDNIQQAMQPVPQAQLASWSFNMLEYIDTLKENRTGITRTNMGVDTNSMNKTATAVRQLTDNSNQRLELITRIFAETGMSDLFRFLIELNQKFIDQETVIRLTNGPMTISPDDLDGEFDLVVNTGMGAGAKETNLQNLQMLQGIITQLAQVGMAGNQQFYNVAKRMIEEIGYKNVDDFVIAPDKMQQAPQQQDDKVSESIQARISEAPIEIQAQYWQKLGYQATPEMFVQNMVAKTAMGAVDSHIKGAMNNGQQGNPSIAGDPRQAMQGDFGPAKGIPQQPAATGIPTVGGQGQY